jgi:mono/diheme cytochrome c family protein
MKRSLWLLLTLALCACKNDFERMLVQDRVDPSAQDDLRLRMMKQGVPPAGSVSHETVVGQPDLTAGCDGRSYAGHIPELSQTELTVLGPHVFTTFCAACHGPTGDGNSPVAQAMEKTKPRSLLAPPVRDYPPGRVFRTIMLGYRMMPSYRNELDVRARWAVTAYLRWLQSEHRQPPPDAQVASTPGPVCQGDEP